MEELLKIVYRNFLCEEDEKSSRELRNIRSQLKDVETAMEKIEKLLNWDLYSEISELVYDGIAELQEAAFMAGFSQCAKIMSNGKIDFMPNETKLGGGFNE